MQSMLLGNHDGKSILTISLLNIPSLKKHSVDLKFDLRLFTSDVIALTETQLLPHDSDNNIVNNLSPFSVYRQDHHSDKYSSMALCTRKYVLLSNCQYFSSINALKFDLTVTNSQDVISFLLLYRKQNSNISQYMDCLKYILNSYNIDIIFGDFNINLFDDTANRPLNSLMEPFSCTQIVQNPTFLSSGSLLDHVYLRQNAFQIFNNSVITVYYSDHDAVNVSIQYAGNY